MATYLFGEAYGSVNETVPMSNGAGVPFVLQNTLDFSLQTVSGGGNTAEAVSIPADTLILAAWMYVHTADTGMTDVELGTLPDLGGGSDDDCFLDGASFATIGYKYHTAADANEVSNAGGQQPGYLVSTAGKLCLSLNSSDTCTAKVTVFALCVKLNIL
jgi:hypothetical protein